ncbi:hypothetical protein BC332_03992 [Capsicum chinense]|nr:hypothetical protein BC332_03992 [Capsicum chinense]
MINQHRGIPLVGTKPINLTIHVPLCQAALGAGANKVQFVDELVKIMSPLELELQNKYDNTALCFAAASGPTRVAKVMVIKNRFLPILRGSKEVTSLHMAALLGHGEIVWYLYSVTDYQYLSKEDYISLLIATINSTLFGMNLIMLSTDVALHILQRMPELSIERDQNE